ncbi:MAG TPA: hypothetical protein VKQ36_08475 [Ktedonobacterales bacterium]|nr:hypothetical protein [Ktedonobacterales bacterium]
MSSIPIRARPAQASVAQVAPALDLATALRWLELDAPAAGAVSPGQPVALLALTTLITPPAACPGCSARRGHSWPSATTTSRFCARCRSRLRQSAHAAPSAHRHGRRAQ